MVSSESWTALKSKHRRKQNQKIITILKRVYNTGKSTMVTKTLITQTRKEMHTRIKTIPTWKSARQERNWTTEHKDTVRKTSTSTTQTQTKSYMRLSPRNSLLGLYKVIRLSIFVSKPSTYRQQSNRFARNPITHVSTKI